MRFYNRTILLFNLISYSILMKELEVRGHELSEIGSSMRKSPQQVNSYDCGLYAIMNTHKFIEVSLDLILHRFSLLSFYHICSVICCIITWWKSRLPGWRGYLRRGRKNGREEGVKEEREVGKEERKEGMTTMRLGAHYSDYCAIVNIFEWLWCSCPPPTWWLI